VTEMGDSMPRSLSVLYFAWLRERVGVSEESVRPPDSVSTVADLIAYLASLDERHASAFRNPGTVRCAVNQEFSESATVLRSGDEIAFFPPVTGG